MWNGLESAATVAQAVGLDVGGLISMIRQAARTAQQNTKDCKHLASRVGLLTELVPCLQDPEARRVLTGLDATLLEAHDLVMSCQRKGFASHLFSASRMSERFRDVDRKIETHLSVIPAISYIAIARRLDCGNGGGTNHTISLSHSQLAAESGREFTLAELVVATNNFAVVLSNDADSGTKVYKGKLLQSGKVEVAVKRLNRSRPGAEDAFFKEQQILGPLRHDHIVPLLGTCAADDGERVLVTQYMPNGSLYDQLHGHMSSPVMASWKTRVQVLLGVARAINHLHCHAVPLIIHGNVASANVLLDAAWAPRLCGFGASVWRAAGVASQPQPVEVARATASYADPEYYSTGHIKSASDVYGLGVVMAEVLTGKPPVVSVWDEAKQDVVAVTLASFAAPTIRDGRLADVLDRRPVPLPTTLEQFQPLLDVANMATQCLCFHGDRRPAISDVVANLEQALCHLI